MTTNKHLLQNQLYLIEPEVYQVCGISVISVIIYKMYSPQGNYFLREEGKFLCWGETHQIQLNNTPKLQFFLNHQPPKQP